MLPNGNVETENFGKGYHFSPRFEFPVLAGKEFHDKLEVLKAERQKALEDIDDLYDRRLTELLSKEEVVAATLK